MPSEKFNHARFERDIAKHRMHVLREDGLYRHLRFKMPDCTAMYFDLITWPGHLCYTGDMGTYVFERLPDMFKFFRTGPRRFGRSSIDYRYWAEKLQGSDRHEGATEFDRETFLREMKRALRARLKDEPERFSQDERHEVWRSFKDGVLDMVDNSDSVAHHLAYEWSYFDGTSTFSLSLDETPDCRKYTHRFLWCCNALRHAIAMYDAVAMAQWAAERERDNRHHAALEAADINWTYCVTFNDWGPAADDGCPF